MMDELDGRGAPPRDERRPQSGGSETGMGSTTDGRPSPSGKLRRRRRRPRGLPKKLAIGGNDPRDDLDDASASASAFSSSSTHTSASGAILSSSLPGRLGSIKKVGVGSPTRFIRKRCNRGRSDDDSHPCSSLTSSVVVTSDDVDIAVGETGGGVKLDEAGLEERLAAAAVEAADGGTARPDDSPVPTMTGRIRPPPPLRPAMEIAARAGENAALAAAGTAGAGARPSSPLFDDEERQQLEPPAMVFGSSRRVVRRSRYFDVTMAGRRRGGFLPRGRRTCRIVVEVYEGGAMGSRSFDEEDGDDDDGWGGYYSSWRSLSPGSSSAAARSNYGDDGDDGVDDAAVVTVVKFLVPATRRRGSGRGDSSREDGDRVSVGRDGGRRRRRGDDDDGGEGGGDGGSDDGRRSGRVGLRRRKWQNRKRPGRTRPHHTTTFGRGDVIAEEDEGGDEDEDDDRAAEEKEESTRDDGHDDDDDQREEEVGGGGFAISTVGITSGPDSDFFVDPHRPISPMASMDTEYRDHDHVGIHTASASDAPTNYSAPTPTTTSPATMATRRKSADVRSITTEPAASDRGGGRKRHNRLRKKKVRFKRKLPLSPSKCRSGSLSESTSASDASASASTSLFTGDEYYSGGGITEKRSRHNTCGRSSKVYHRYVEKYVMPLRYVRVHRRSGNVLLVEACYNHNRKTREMTFRDELEAIAFEAVIRRERDIESARVDRELGSVFGDEVLRVGRRRGTTTGEEGDETAEPSTEASPLLPTTAAAAGAAMGMGRFMGEGGGARNGMGGVLNQLGLASGGATATATATAAAAAPVGTDVVVRILIDIVSAWDLRVGDFTSSDPYCVVWMGDREVHRTKYISKTLNPIWTVETSSFFVLETNAREFLSCSEGLCFEVRDFDALSTGSSLGAAMVPPKVLYESRGERMEFDLSPLPGKKHVAKGKLAMRCRPATDEDVDFLRGLDKKEHHYLNFIHDHIITPTGTGGDVKRLFTRANQIVHGRKLCRVRPGPDPERERETEWMTRDEIEAEAYKASQRWAEAGSGKLGQVFLEILGCDGLPNKDSGIAGNKTDAFVAAVFEDCFVVTDVIDDTLCPRWLPWTQRAFVFNILHPSSPIYLGVFDFDRLSAHDAIGRVTVDISNLPPDTDCVLHYNLYSSARVTRRDRFGSIIIRLRVEWEDEREAMLSLLDIPPEVHINCKTRKDFELVKFTCEGKHNRHQYSLDTITSYLEELATFNLVWIYAKDALINLLLWRYNVQLSPLVPCLTKDGESKVLGLAMTTRRLSISVPLQSIMMFLAGIILVERPHYIPSFCMVSFAWVMLELMSYRLRHPSPWRRCRSFRDLFFIVVFGCALDQSRTIQAHENEAAINEFTRFWDERIALAAKESERLAEESLKRQEEYEKEMQEIGNQSVNIATRRRQGFTVDPVKPFLFPIQLYLAMLCDMLRVGRNILIWEEVFYSFWVTVASLVLAVSFLFVPWGFAIMWSARITVWTCLGPWMKALDVLYYSRIRQLTEQEKMEEEEKKLKARRLITRKAAKDARAKRENAEKLKAMKKYRFGEYIMKVPIIRLDRHRDFPLIQSRAIPHQSEELASTEVSRQTAHRIFVPGQQLDEDLIPKPIQDLRASMGPHMKSPLAHHYCSRTQEK